MRGRRGPPPGLVIELFAQGVHHDLQRDPKRFDPAADLAAAYREQPDLRADDPHVSAIVRRGGKLMLYQGWPDPSVVAQQTLGYFEAVVAAAGGADAAAWFVRLYLVPGMYHCGGGGSADRFGGEAGSIADDPGHDMLSAVIAWTEQGRAPGALIAARVRDGQVTRTRPLCPYPQHAVYDGRGDPENASSFECRLDTQQ